MCTQYFGLINKLTMDIQQEDEEEDGEGGLETQVNSQCCGTVTIFYGSGSEF
jgi:hypothetical protein